MSLFVFSIILPFTLMVNGCLNNVLWKDRFGWTCKDYERDPLECKSKLAISVGGIDAFEACCACNFFVDRRRDYSTCLSACSADEDACEAGCAADRAGCVDDCNDDFPSSEDPGPVFTPYPTPQPGGNGTTSLETWMIILIVLGILLVICFICIILYFLCMPQDEGNCQDEELTQQPMLIGGGCDAPRDTPCDTPCDGQYERNGGAQMYGQVERQQW